jgi:fumarylacetoacetate (FAA) hydrolase
VQDPQRARRQHRRLGHGVEQGCKADRRGYSCIAEQRCLETIEFGQPVTQFMRFGDTIRIEMLDEKGKSIFGAIEQKVVRWRSKRRSRESGKSHSGQCAE